MRTLIVVPTYNEVDNLKALLEGILSVTPQDVEVLVVDDNSPDGTGHLAESLADQNPRIHVLRREGKQGLGTAYVTGFKWGLARAYGALVQMDADFSHDPKYLPRMLELIRDFDGVLGSRYVEGGGTVNWGVGRKILSRGGSIYSRLILGVGIRDFTGGFNAWRRQVLEAVELDTLRSDGYSFQIELKFRATMRGFRLKEFPIVFEDRKVGQSKMSRGIVIEALRRVWELKLRSIRRGEGLAGRLLGSKD